MTWTASLGLKSVSDTITSTEFNQLLGNLLHLATRYSFRITATSNQNTGINSATAHDVAFDNGSGDRRESWDWNGIIATPDMATSASLLEVGDGAAGVWLVGGGYRVANNDSTAVRRFQLTKDSTENLMRENHQNQVVIGPNFAHSTIQDFAAGEAFTVEFFGTDAAATDPEFTIPTVGVGSKPTAVVVKTAIWLQRGGG